MNLYEIRLQVGAYLSNHNLTRCVLVCKEWHHSFLPLLYTTCISSSHRNSWPSFKKHMEHVRDLHVDKLTPDMLQTCQLLTRLQFSLCSITSIVDLIQANPNLRAIDMSGYSSPEGSLRVMETIVQFCPRVTQLALNNYPLTGAVFNQFSNLASRLTKLTLLNCWPGRTAGAASTTPGLQEEDIGSWLVFPELRDLKVVGPPKDISSRDQLRIFEKSSKLEALSWKMVAGAQLKTDFVRALCDKLQERDSNLQGSDGASCCWPRLDSIKMSGLEENALYNSDVFMAKLLQSCPNKLRRFVSVKSLLGSKSWLALQRHLGTLEVLHLATAGWFLQEIMASCPKLRELKSGTVYVGDMADTIQAEKWRRSAAEKRIQRLDWNIFAARRVNNQELADFLEASKQLWPDPSSPPRPWVCRGLRSFRVTLNRMEFDDEANRQVFERFTQLRQLEVINVRPGWADRMGGFDFRQYPVYLGYVKKANTKDVDGDDDDDDDDDDENDNHRFHGEICGVKQIMELPTASRILEIWPAMTTCRLSK